MSGDSSVDELQHVILIFMDTLKEMDDEDELQHVNLIFMDTLKEMDDAVRAAYK